MKSIITVRPAHADEVPALLALWCRAVDATHHFLTPDDRQAIEQELRDFLPAAPLLVAADDRDRPLAFMLVEDRKIEALFVDTQARGSGVGRQMVAYAVKTLAAIYTDVNAQNQQGCGFWQHMGFVQTGYSPLDGAGRRYPLWHLTLKQT